jgi:hypothetical protein
MFLTGILYLLFEDAILEHGGSVAKGSKPTTVGSRVIVGLQVRLIIIISIGMCSHKGTSRLAWFFLH